MSKSVSIFSGLLCTFIWGTTFIAQDTGMEKIGPYVFNGVRFFVGFLALIPFYLFLEKKNTKKILSNNKSRDAQVVFKSTSASPKVRMVMESGEDVETRRLIKGTICGVRVEDVEEPLMQEIRYLDKLVDELAQGKDMLVILRS